MYKTLDLKLLDPIPRPVGTEGAWAAERPEELPEFLRVWAPCNCCLVEFDGQSVLTGCDSETCVFTYEKAYEIAAELDVPPEVAEIVKKDLTVN